MEMQLSSKQCWLIAAMGVRIPSESQKNSAVFKWFKKSVLQTDHS